MRITKIRNWFHWPFLVLLVAAAPFLFGNDYYRSVFTLAGINALAVLGLHLLLVQCGQASLGQNGFLALGAYGTALLSYRTKQEAWLPLVLSVSGTALLAYILGRPLSRLQHHFFAIATLGVGAVIHTLIAETVDLTGGNSGLGGYPVPYSFQNNSLLLYAVIWATVLIVAHAFERLLRSDPGRCMRAVAHHETTALVMGVDTQRIKTHVFVSAAALTALAGGLLAYHVGFLTPNLFGLPTSVNLLTMAVIGGGRPRGAIYAALLLTILPEVVAGLKDYHLVASGLLLILMVVLPELVRRGSTAWTKSAWRAAL